MNTCLVNLAYLDPATIGGVGRIAHEISRLLALEANARTTRVIFVVGWRFAGEFARWLGAAAVIVPYLTRYDFALTCRLLRPDIIISPLFGLEPFQHMNTRHVAGMPDALALDHPELFSPVDLAYRQQVYTNLSRAFRVVTLSQHARSRLLNHTRLQPEQVVVAPLGADPQEHTGNGPLPDLPIRYVLYPANLWPHKRHELLLKIMTHVWARQPDLHLVLTGGRSGQDKRRLADLIAANRCPPERVHDFGFVPDAQLALLYHKAEAVLFVSRYEGFGMPLLEAMHHGCPVICAPEAAIPEVVDGAGLFVDGDDPAAWADALLNILPLRRGELVSRGLERAAQFTWAKTRSRWQTVLREAGLDFTPSPLVDPLVTHHAKRSQPLLERMGSIANHTGRGRLKRIPWMPVLFGLQARLLWSVYRYCHHPITR